MRKRGWGLLEMRHRKAGRADRVSLSLHGEGIHGPQKAAICAPEQRVSGLPVCNRQSPRRPDCQFQTASTFLKREAGRTVIVHANG